MNSLRGLAWISLLCLAGIPALARAAGGLESSGEAVGLGQPMSERALELVRGRDGLSIPALSSQYSQASLSAAISDNTLGGNSSTGTNVAGSAVFSGASGIATMIQNSGNQVIIQNSVTVNLSLK